MASPAEMSLSTNDTPNAKITLDKPSRPRADMAQSRDIMVFFLIFRLVNALCVRTFFQPDEYFQALEPAWNMAFNRGSGAWLTWEWEYQLRSSLHPAIFGVAYAAANGVLDFLKLVPSVKATVLVALPKIIQSIFAATSDFYTWKLAGSLYGGNSNAAWAAFWASVFNPWLWYCSTRTFSNSLETTLTVAALYCWPWEILGDAKESKQQAVLQRCSSVNRLRVSLVLAAIAVLLRPTNILVWLAILTLTLTRFTLDGESPMQRSSLCVLVREIVLCGSAVLAVSVLSDRLYFGFWTFPPYKWLYFNLSQDLAVFYGHMPWHYYLSQGLPLLSTSFLPFVLIGLYKATTSPPSESVLQANTLRTLSFTVLTMITCLSMISHKEVRFIYPLLPILQVLAAPYLASFFIIPTAATEHLSSPSKGATRSKTTLRHKFFLANILSINILLATYLGTFHQSAVVSVNTFLRHEFERLHPDYLSLSQPRQQPEELFVFFFTPCHSTPWRSHLVYPALRARALTCEPPLHTAPGSPERIHYRDEADRFYDNPVKFLGKEVTEIPRYIVGFAGAEGLLNRYLEETPEGKRTGIKLSKVWEGFNGLFNEDWRRRGKLVVWDTGVYNGRDGKEVTKAYS